MATAKRKPIGKKTRFEVFKRDSFTCQYCGRKAPEVLLHVDHIKPVAGGGGNDLLNLITACVDCNAGKRDVPLSDQSAIAKQRAQLDELAERREQLDMILEWRKGLLAIQDDSLAEILKAYSNLAPGWTLNQRGQQAAKRLLRKFGLEAILDAMDISAEAYLRYDDDGKPIDETVDYFWRKVGGVCAVKAMPQTEQRLRYIRGILKHRLTYVNHGIALQLLRDAVDAGIELDELERCAKECRNWSDWQWVMNEGIKSIGQRKEPNA